MQEKYKKSKSEQDPHREKIHKLEDDLKITEKNLAQTAKDLHTQQMEVERLLEENERFKKKQEELQSQIAELRTEKLTQKEEISKLNSLIQKKSNMLETTLQDMDSKNKEKSSITLEFQAKLQENERKLQSLSEEIIKKDKKISDYEQEGNSLKVNAGKMQEENNILVKELTALKHQNETKLMELELKCEAIQQEYNNVKAENGRWKLREEDLIQQIAEIEKAKEKYREDNIEYKKVNKAMKKKMGDIENEISKYAKEREYEMQEVQKRDEAVKEKASKIQVLQEVQNKIAQFKTEQQYKKTPNKQLLN